MDPVIPITVSPESINEYIAKQIIDSALGEHVEAAIKDTIKGLGKYSQDPIRNGLNSEINKYMMELIRTKYALQIDKAVREAMTPEFINNLCTSFINSITAKINNY